MSKTPAKLLEHRQKVLDEIFNTEHSYNMGLQMVNILCTKKIQDEVNNGRLKLNNPEILDMFVLLTSIQDASFQFVEKLHNLKTKKDMPFFDAFEGFGALIENYFKYIYAFHKTNNLISEEVAKNPDFKKIIDKYEKDVNDTISAVLITPIQRPPRYRLLLQELIKYTPEGYPEVEKLKASLAEVCTAISNVDTKIDEFDEFNLMTEVQEKISDYKFIDSKGKRMHFNGHATKFSRSYTNNRYLVLFNDALLVCEKGIVSQWRMNKLFKSGEYLIMPVDDNEPFINAVDIRQKDKSFRCNLDSKKAKKELLEAFDLMLKENKIDKTELEFIGFAPVWIPDDLAKVCMECGKQFSFVKRRHHCRWCGKCVCGDCWKNEIKLPNSDKKPQHVCNECYQKIKAVMPELENGNDADNDTSFVPSQWT